MGLRICTPVSTEISLLHSNDGKQIAKEIEIKGIEPHSFILNNY